MGGAVSKISRAGLSGPRTRCSNPRAVKPDEGDALLADGDVGETRPHLEIEAVAVHAEIRRWIAKAYEPR